MEFKSTFLHVPASAWIVLALIKPSSERVRLFSLNAVITDGGFVGLLGAGGLGTTNLGESSGSSTV